MSEIATALPSSFEPFSLFVEACDTSNRERGPHFIHVRIDPALLKKVLRRHELCNTESISVCTENLAPFDWDRAPHSPDSVDHGTNQSTQVTDWQLHVDGDQFWFQGDVNGTRLTESRMVTTQAVVKRASGSREPWFGFSRIGDILVYVDEADTSPATFEERLKRSRPEVAAAALAAEMAERIAAQDPDASNPSNPFAPVRRHMSV